MSKLIHAHDPVYETLCGASELAVSATTADDLVTCLACLRAIAAGRFAYDG